MKTDREKQSLRGPVKIVEIETAQLKEHEGRLVEEPWFGHKITFNEDGNIVEQVNRNPDGSAWSTLNDYSGTGKLLATRHYDSSGNLTGEIRYAYDEERLIAEQYVTVDGKVSTHVNYTYDDEGRKVKIEEIESADNANMLIGIEGTNSSIGITDARRIETMYDSRDEAIEVKVFNAEGVLTSRMEIKRDARGNPLEETQHVGDTLPFGPCSTADACSTEDMPELTEGQIAEFEAEMARMFSPGAVISRHIHSYDGEGRLIESRLTMMGMEASRRTFAYDEFGNKSEEVSYGEGGAFESKAIFTREYDERGNWTKELVSSASGWDAEFGLSTPVHVTRRLITYY